jgi:hypothetical protein
MSITYYDCSCVALGIQDAMRMRRIMPSSTVILHIIL